MLLKLQNPSLTFIENSIFEQAKLAEQDYILLKRKLYTELVPETFS